MTISNIGNRFVVLRHEMPASDQRASHWDLMLEFQDQLETWALAESLEPQKIAAVKLPPHRLEYLDYEGPVSGQRGSVHQVMSGIWLDDSKEPIAIERRQEKDSANQFPREVLLAHRAGRWRLWFQEMNDGWIVEVH